MREKQEKSAAVFMWDMSGLNVLIPKRRGAGFLRCPLYHNRVPALAQIEMDERVDMCGLEGYLCLDYRYREDQEREAIVARVMPRLAAHFGFSCWRESRADFWAVLIREGVA